jgi:hypothetical protein
MATGGNANPLDYFSQNLSQTAAHEGVSGPIGPQA